MPTLAEKLLARAAEMGHLDRDRDLPLCRELARIARQHYKDGPLRYAQECLDLICEELYLVDDGTGKRVIDPDKEWSAETLDAVAELARPHCLACDGTGEDRQCNTCQKCLGAGLAPEGWKTIGAYRSRQRIASITQ